MEDTTTYEALCASILQKPCFNGPNGRAWQTVMGSNMDLQLERLYQAKEVRYPDLTPADALYYLANERGLERVLMVGTGGTLEAEALHRARLRRAWTIWLLSGSQQGHVDELGWTGLNGVRCLRRVDFSTPPAVGSVYVRDFARQVWSQFDILIRDPGPVEALEWGSGWLWGDGSTWGTTMSSADIALLRRLVRDHKSAHDTCTYFYFVFATGTIWGAFTWGSGTLWGGVGNVVTLICGEEWWETAGYM